MSFVHSIRVRYGECDMQRVVFNAHYLAYCDDAIDSWFRDALSFDGQSMESAGFDAMVKTASLTWHAPFVFGETADLRLTVTRWGRSSFDIAVNGTADGAPRFDATLTYVSVVPGVGTPTAVPDRVRDALS